jgi:hypothetical protein
VPEAQQDMMDSRVRMELQGSKVYLGTQVCLVHLDSKEREAWKENLEDLADRVKMYLCSPVLLSLFHIETASVLRYISV